jgi:hypothetical protein
VTTVASAVRDRLLDAHGDVLASVSDCADRVVADWDGDAARDAAAVAGPLRAALSRAGVLDRLPAVLADVVAATGRVLRAEPVAKPPYVAVTSRGPVLRATLSDGRLVATLAVFDVRRDPPRYVRGASDPADIPEVCFYE